MLRHQEERLVRDSIILMRQD